MFSGRLWLARFELRAVMWTSEAWSRDEGMNWKREWNNFPIFPHPGTWPGGFEDLGGSDCPELPEYQFASLLPYLSCLSAPSSSPTFAFLVVLRITSFLTVYLNWAIFIHVHYLPCLSSIAGWLPDFSLLSEWHYRHWLGSHFKPQDFGIFNRTFGECPNF